MVHESQGRCALVRLVREFESKVQVQGAGYSSPVQVQAGKGILSSLLNGCQQVLAVGYCKRRGGKNRCLLVGLESKRGSSVTAGLQKPVSSDALQVAAPRAWRGPRATFETLL